MDDRSTKHECTMRKLLIVVVCFFTMDLALGQGVPHEVIEHAKTKMSSLEWLEGKWSGNAWAQLGPDVRETAKVHETAEFRLDRTLLILEGLGKNEDGSVVHAAIGVISFDPSKDEYVMRAYRPGGIHVDADIEITESGLVWGFEHPQAGRMRYTVTHTEAGEWKEAGEMSRDAGETWFPFFGMTLTRENE
jgi:hypothetical protein